MSVELFDPIDQSRPSESLFPLRPNEPDYALLQDRDSQATNRYGDRIDLVEVGDDPLSLNINGVDAIGFNPNRNKQHAFHFTADNCIGCHACESACSEKNDLPPHLSFRSVGYVEGGSYPNYTRMNISMACNHCDDPVCLKGCPTRAYTKHSEYGAVIQDPDICFGCGYCTWVCPYNAPQLDPVNGQVEKCNMCVDRLEVGLKPACVSACLGNALDFGVVENTPERRQQTETRIPGFPDPEITHPNIRFEQQRSLPREMRRTDSAPIKYQRDDEADSFRPAIDRKAGDKAQWNLRRLSSRENPLVAFTLCSQAAIGTLAICVIAGWLGWSSLDAITATNAYLPTLLAALGMIAVGMLMSTVHLGKPWRFYRGFNNWRHSPVSREGLGVVVFMTFLGLHALASLPAAPWFQSLVDMPATLAAVSHITGTVSSALSMGGGTIALYYMYRCYRIKARPFWDHWQTGASFVGNCLTLGAILVGVGTMVFANADFKAMVAPLACLMLLGMLLEAAGLWHHQRTLKAGHNEGSAAHYVQVTTFGKTYYARNTLLAINACAAVLLATTAPLLSPLGLVLAFSALALSVLLTATIGRALFYVLVIPTTMPGAFFWKNKSFEQHARDIGLARMPQVGVAEHGH